VGDIPGRLGFVCHPDEALIGARVWGSEGREALRTAEVIEGAVASGGALLDTQRGWRGAYQHLQQFVRAYRSLTARASVSLAVERGLAVPPKGGVQALGAYPAAPHW
jgi:hypothetical protein